jgi:hypothetical protein
VADAIGTDPTGEAEGVTDGLAAGAHAAMNRPIKIVAAGRERVTDIAGPSKRFPTERRADDRVASSSPCRLADI